MSNEIEQMYPESQEAMLDLEQRLQVDGKIRLQSGGRAIATASLVIYASLMIGIWFGFQDEHSTDATSLMLITMGVSTVLVVLLYAWLRQASRKAAFTVSEDGWKDAYGIRFGWDEIRGAGVWSYQGNDQPVLELTDEAYARVIGAQSGVTRRLTKANAKLLRTKNAIILPGNTTVPAQLVAMWVNDRIDRTLHRKRDDTWIDRPDQDTHGEDFSMLLPASRR